MSKALLPCPDDAVESAPGFPEVTKGLLLALVWEYLVSE
jgi:hypothetical protein